MNGSRSSGDGSTITSVQEKPVYVSGTVAVNGDLFDNSAHSHQLENAALQRLGALLSSSSKSDTSSHIFCEKSDGSEISSNLLTLDTQQQQQQQLNTAAPIATAEESIKSSTEEDESTVSWQPVMTSHQGGVKVSNLNSPGAMSERNLISSELEAAFCSLDQEMQHQHEVQSGTEI